MRCELLGEGGRRGKPSHTWCILGRPLLSDKAVPMKLRTFGRSAADLSIFRTISNCAICMYHAKNKTESDRQLQSFIRTARTHASQLPQRPRADTTMEHSIKSRSRQWSKNGDRKVRNEAPKKAGNDMYTSRSKRGNTHIQRRH